MKIKKITEKLDFDVEAQAKKIKCPFHPNKKTTQSCAYDCKHTNWSGSNALAVAMNPKLYKLLCKKSTYYDCSVSHLL